jgi:hypothetical protein
MNKLLIAAFLGTAMAAAPALAQSGGSGGLSGGSPGSPGDGGMAGTSSPRMGPSANAGVPTGMTEGAPAPGRDTRGQRASTRRANGDMTQGTATTRAARKRAGG